MANRFLNNIKINDSYTLPGADGTEDQIIKTDGAGELTFIDQGDVIAGEADKAKSVILRVKNSTASPMTKGQVICEAVSASPPNGNLIEVALADNNGTNTMPALGILNEDLDAAGGANDEGDAIMFGKVSGIDTSAFDVGDEVFVSDTPGGLTITKPTGVKYIQKVGVVIRDDNTNGTIEVFGAGRVNDVPTPLYIDHANQRLGVGITSPQTTLHMGVQNANPVGTEEFRLESRGGSGFGGNSIVNLYTGQYGTSGVYFGDNPTYSLQPGRIEFIDVSNSLNYDSTQYHYWKIGGSTKMTLKNSFFGIGTTSPGVKLDIVSSSSGSQIELTSPTPGIKLIDSNLTTRYAEIKAENGNINIDIDPGQAEGASHFSVDIDNSEKFRITKDGNVGIGTTSPSETLTLQTRADGLGSEGIFIKNPFAGTSPVVNSKSPFLSLATSTTSAYNSTIYMGRNATATNQESKIEWSNANNGLSIYVAGQGSYREHVRFGDLANSTARTFFNGNVGIGTTSPRGKLDITNGSTGQTYSNISGLLIDVNGTSNSYYGLRVGSSTGNSHLAVTNAGNVGIGTTSPQSKLHVSSGTANEDCVVIIESDTDNNDETSNPRLELRQDGGAVIGKLGYRDNTNSLELINQYAEALYLGTSNSTDLTILSNGNVGIGTTSPSNKLDVNGNIEASRIILPTTGTAGGGTVTTPAGKLDIRSDSTWSNSAIIARTTTNQNPVLAFYRPSGGSATSYPWWLEANGSTFQIKTGSAANIGSETVSTKVTINSSGNVGIGTTNPTSKLTVVDDILLTGSSPSLTLTDATSSFVIKTNTAGEGLLQTSGTSKPIRFFRNNGSNESMRINGDGNVGIGTTSPAAKLEVEGVDHLLQLSAASSTGNPYLSFNQAGTRRSFIQHADNGDYLKLASEYGGISFFTGTGGTETQKMTILSGGNVGIGTTSPQQKLDVNGDIAIKNATQLSFDSNNGTLSVASHAGQLDLLSSSIFINYSSNVGIGTTTPSYLLEVSGSAAKSTGTTWINTSDERTKENIQNYTKGLNDIVQLQPRVFDYNGKGSTEKSKENIGLIAQEVIDVYPEAIGTFKAKLDETDAKETDIYNLDFHSISISMINAIKELNEKVKILETKIQTLENQ